MPIGEKPNLTQFLIEERRRAPQATGELNSLITAVSWVCKAISHKVAYGALAEQVYTLAPQLPGANYRLFFEPIDIEPMDGACNLDVNVAVGSVFSITRAVNRDGTADSTPGTAPDTTPDTTPNFAPPGQASQPQPSLQPGKHQVCAGYAIYGPSTLLVLTLGTGTHAFTLEPQLGEWVLSHPNIRIPRRTREFAINASNSRFWEPAVKRYVDECLAGSTGPRGADFNMRWIASLVAETHRILMRGGVFISPRDGHGGGPPGRLRLLCEANPIAFLVEQAGGMASNGRRRLMAVQPESVHQRVGFVFGSADEVARIEQYHEEEPPDTYPSPLFGKRGLFAASA